MCMFSWLAVWASMFSWYLVSSVGFRPLSRKFDSLLPHVLVNFFFPSCMDLEVIQWLKIRKFRDKKTDEWFLAIPFYFFSFATTIISL